MGSALSNKQSIETNTKSHLNSAVSDNKTKKKPTKLQRHRTMELKTFSNIINFLFDDKTSDFNQNVINIIFKYYYRCILLCYQNESGHCSSPSFYDENIENEYTVLDTTIIYSDGCIYQKHVSWDDRGNCDHKGNSWLDDTCAAAMEPEPGLLLFGLDFNQDLDTLDALVYYATDYLAESITKLTPVQIDALTKCCTHLGKLQIDEFFRVDSNGYSYDNYKIFHNGKQLINVYRNKDICVNEEINDQKNGINLKEEESEVNGDQSDSSAWNQIVDSISNDSSDENTCECDKWDLFLVKQNQEIVSEFKHLMGSLHGIYDVEIDKKMFCDDLVTVFFDSNESAMTIDKSEDYVVIKSESI